MPLTDPEQCKEKFNCREAVLFEIKDIADINELRYDSSGKSRFYEEVFSIGNRIFLVANYWYGPSSAQKSQKVKDNRTPFYEWIIRL